VTLDGWIRAHSFLATLAQLRARIDAAIESADITHPPIPEWSDYREEFLEGVPLIHSVNAAIDLSGAGRAIDAVVRTLAREPSDRVLRDDLQALAVDLSGRGASDAVDWLLGGDDYTPARPGLLRCLGWLTLSHSLRPVVDAFAVWRDDEKWLRRYCPSCGSLPAMAQLVGVDPGRLRLLWCGCCGTNWRYGRTACPFCEAESHQLASVGIEGESGLRIDYCESCRGYLKTYDGHGSEAVLLADWTSLHLDLLARDRGWRRLAASLYEMDGMAASCW
jgi:FdhE protein